MVPYQHIKYAEILLYLMILFFNTANRLIYILSSHQTCILFYFDIPPTPPPPPPPPPHTHTHTPPPPPPPPHTHTHTYTLMWIQGVRQTIFYSSYIFIIIPSRKYFLGNMRYMVLPGWFKSNMNDFFIEKIVFLLRHKLFPILLFDRWHVRRGKCSTTVTSLQDYRLYELPSCPRFRGIVDKLLLYRYILIRLFPIL